MTPTTWTLALLFGPFFGITFGLLLTGF